MIRPRSLFAGLLSLALGVALSSGGCANGGSTSSGAPPGGGNDGSVTPDGTAPADATSDGSPCSAPNATCGTTCTNLASDPKNCGACGVVCGAIQVCNGGLCTYSCPASESLCDGPPDGGREDDASDNGGEGGGAGGGGFDGALSTDGGPADDASGDSGAPAPYCANLSTDNSNCGACGTVCTGEHTCQSGSCQLSCGTGQIACTVGDLCIPAGTCCSTTECTVIPGAVCPQPGSTCQCAGGQRLCPGLGCIGSSVCCDNSDCTGLAGATCPTPGQSCQCANGQQACLSTQSCIPLTACCTQAGECCDDPLGKSCSAATVQGTLALGGSESAQGYITATGEEDWLKVTFNNNANTTFHAHVVLTANPSDNYVFDLSTDCAGTLLDCGEGGICQSKTDWEVYYTGGDPTGTAFVPVAIGTVYIKVYRTSGAPTCDPWTLTISE